MWIALVKVHYSSLAFMWAKLSCHFWIVKVFAVKFKYSLYRNNLYCINFRVFENHQSEIFLNIASAQLRVAYKNGIPQNYHGKCNDRIKSCLANPQSRCPTVALGRCLQGSDQRLTFFSHKPGNIPSSVTVPLDVSCLRPILVSSTYVITMMS